MTEELIYFIWQFQYVANQPLITTDGETVDVLHPGFRNGNAGPDFLNARLRIAGVEWVGTVEAHVKTSDWLVHRHQSDKAYDNVILHIVWHHDRPVPRPDGTRLPTLELAPLTSDNLLSRYGSLTTNADVIPCAGQFRMVKPLRQTAMLDKALLERLERKATDVQSLYEATGQDWEETAYRLLAMHLGSKVNADPMEQLTRMVPLRLLHKHRNNLAQLEALLFGTAGLLEATDAEADEYLTVLRRENQFLATKYALTTGQLPTHIWKWGKLRPAAFPTMRIAQLARLIHDHGSLFSLLVGTADAPSLLALLQIMPSAYWQTHYRFGKAGAKVSSSLGEATATGLLINVAVPLLAAYAKRKDQPDLLDRAISLLEQLPAEDNRIIRLWDSVGLNVRTAFDSQASIELYTNFCTPKRCLNCQIGMALVRE
ncbi:DUF2851 family protein [Fibrella sp. HMF5335]|uniref:DUF2851 family protein n=1 Tax=Fibrella rubiginis TaxID=2817060 RepID=A0A939GMA5_9BACT|nr:DUF2851 family protein [Fibrella rubiginis]